MVPVCLCRVCKRLNLQFSVDMMVESLSQLCIVHPHGLFAGAECLTFINKGFLVQILSQLLLTGQLVYFLGAAKGTDEKRRMYNPISTSEEYILSLSKTELMTIGQ